MLLGRTNLYISNWWNVLYINFIINYNLLLSSRDRILKNRIVRFHFCVGAIGNFRLEAVNCSKLPISAFKLVNPLNFLECLDIYLFEEHTHCSYKRNNTEFSSTSSNRYIYQLRVYFFSKNFYIIRLLKTTHPIEFLDSSESDHCFQLKKNW